MGVSWATLIASASVPQAGSCRAALLAAKPQGMLRLCRRKETKGYFVLAHRFSANAQNQLWLSSTLAFVKPAAMSISGNPSFVCPE